MRLHRLFVSALDEEGERFWLENRLKYGSVRPVIPRVARLAIGILLVLGVFIALQRVTSHSSDVLLAAIIASIPLAIIERINNRVSTNRWIQQLPPHVQAEHASIIRRKRARGFELFVVGAGFALVIVGAIVYFYRHSS